MTIEEIRVLVAADESRTLELKKTTGELRDEATVQKFRTVQEERLLEVSVVQNSQITECCVCVTL